MFNSIKEYRNNVSGLGGHDPTDAVEFLRTEKFREQVLREGL
jgi:hypothetical protein